MQTLFLSDLHLSEETPEIAAYFKQFIQYCLENKNDIESIYLLGDFFEFWIGDDYHSEFTQRVYAALASVSKESNINCYFMHGNRDFLIGKGSQANFIEQTGFNIINDPHCIELNGEKVLLSHGDSLCTDDAEYQHIRQMVRNDLWQKEILSKTIDERIQFALASREQSKQKDNTGANEKISDVNQQTVENIMTENHCLTLIHGHTHRPETHPFDLNKQSAKRIVLAAWYKQCSFLKYENNSYTTVNL